MDKRKLICVVINGINGFHENLFGITSSKINRCNIELIHSCGSVTSCPVHMLVGWMGGKLHFHPPLSDHLLLFKRPPHCIVKETGKGRVEVGHRADALPQKINKLERILDRKGKLLY